MGNSASSEKSPSLQMILDALNDTKCQAILRETAHPMTANELTDACDIPQSTLYRKLDVLSNASLVRESDQINPSGGRTTYYVRDFSDVTISMDPTAENGLSVSVQRPPRNADERLADIWSQMSDEL